ncbi:uncharacterized protein METZ01_LOCUS91097 [marine metagenome]|uniref:Uncharacterized protein n=1 Tax=marine metagenome TaxID=408172 RepID=A0A381VFQ8_9ZZZZ
MATVDTCAKCGDSQKRHRGHDPYVVVESYSYFNAPEKHVLCPKCDEILRRNQAKGVTIKLPDATGDVEGLNYSGRGSTR